MKFFVFAALAALTVVTAGCYRSTCARPVAAPVCAPVPPPPAFAPTLEK